MSKHSKTRAERDAEVKSAILSIPERGITVAGMQTALGDANRDNVRLVMDRLEYHRVLVVNRAHKPVIYKPTTDWQERLKDYIAWRDRKISSTATNLVHNKRKTPNQTAEDAAFAKHNPSAELLALAMAARPSVCTRWYGARPALLG